MDSIETIDELELLIRSKRTVIYLVSQEENRVLSALENLCSKADTSWDLLKWDIVSGLYSTFPEFLPAKASDCALDQEEVLSWYKKLIADTFQKSISRSPYVPEFDLLDWREIFIKYTAKYKEETWWRDEDYPGKPRFQFDKFLNG